MVERIKDKFQAGAIAEEVLASIRTVVAFGGQKKEVQRLRYFEVTLLCCEYLYNWNSHCIVFTQLEKYCSELKDAKKNSIVKGEEKKYI